MSFLENLKMAFSSIAANKMRALLTMLGIIIGISAVITITTLGTTLRSTVKGALNFIGTNMFYVYLEEKNTDSNYDSVEITANDYINMTMLKELTETYPDEFYLGAENPFSSGTVINSKNETIRMNVIGAYDGIFDYNGLKILAGRRLSLQDSLQKKYTCCVSEIFVRQYFKNGEEPIGQTIPITLENGKVFEFTIVGVYKYNSMNLGPLDGSKEIDKKTPVYIPYSISNELSGYYFEDRFYGMIIAYNTNVDVNVAQNDLQTFFDQKYESNRNWGVYIYSVEDEVAMIDMVINIITIIVSVIAAISLIVGGVGVMNIMLVSVTERTREIGIRKALGAKKRSIKLQFVTEAIIICLIGGIIGIIIGLLNGELVGVVANLIVQSNPEYTDMLGTISIVPSVGAIIISLIFSMLTGVFFGLYPAGKAAKMNPIDALRYD